MIKYVFVLCADYAISSLFEKQHLIRGIEPARIASTRGDRVVFLK